MEKSGGRMGRPRIELDMRKVVELDAKGVSRAAIARRFGVSYSTLRTRFKEVEGTPLSALSRGSALVSDVDATS